MHLDLILYTSDGEAHTISDDLLSVNLDNWSEVEELRQEVGHISDSTDAELVLAIVIDHGEDTLDLDFDPSDLSNLDQILSEGIQEATDKMEE